LRVLVLVALFQELESLVFSSHNRSMTIQSQIKNSLFIQ
jgi:hypothetical protein